MRVLYVLGIFQFFAMAYEVLTYPPLTSILFTYSASVGFNATRDVGVVHIYSLDLGMPCLVVSLGVLVFVSVSIHLASDGLGDSLSYSDENLTSLGYWNALFWFDLLGIHLVWVATVCSLVDLFACLVGVYLLVHSLFVICRPVSDDHLTMQTNSWIVAFVSGLVVVLYCTPAQYPGRYVTILLIVILDYILVVGHTFDRSPTVQTVLNCRLCWTLSSCLCLAALYGSSHDRLLMS